MAKFEGNIFTKAGGSIGSITFSRARDRQGKVQTARERVIPINPQTAPQTNARDNMRDSVRIVRYIVSRGYAGVFDRSVSKLPGYQSLISIYQNNKTNDGTNITFVSTPPDIRRGRNINLQIVSVVNHGGGEYEINFSVSGEPVESTDELVIMCVCRSISSPGTGGFRSEIFTVSPPLGTQTFVDMGNFLGEESGLFFGAFIHRVGTNDPSSAGAVTWNLST